MQRKTQGLKILRCREVEEKIGLGKTKLYEMVSRAEFPAPVRLGSAKAVGWVEGEIDEWLAQRIADRDCDKLPVAA
jgi:prophage regulatory protein